MGGGGGGSTPFTVERGQVAGGTDETPFHLLRVKLCDTDAHSVSLHCHGNRLVEHLHRLDFLVHFQSGYLNSLQ